MSEEAGLCPVIVTQDLGMTRAVASADSRTNGESFVRRHCLASVRRIRYRLFVKQYHWRQAWIYGYDPETTAQSTAWKSPSQRPKKFAKFEERQKLCSQFSSIKTVFCVASSLKRVKQQMRNVINGK
jgi:hypothetical protein